MGPDSLTMQSRACFYNPSSCSELQAVILASNKSILKWNQGFIQEGSFMPMSTKATKWIHSRSFGEAELMANRQSQPACYGTITEFLTNLWEVQSTVWASNCNNSSPSLTRADLLHHDMFSYLKSNGSEADFLTINFWHVSRSYLSR